MKHLEIRCLGVMVVYDYVRAPSAISRFKEVISKSFKYNSVRVVTNNTDLDGDIIGSNKCGEFSGWAEGVNYVDYKNYDIIIFANDTFHTRRPFTTGEEKIFIKKILSAHSKDSLFLVGQLHWHIDYRLMRNRKKFILNWVRTNMFAISTDAARRIGGVSLAQEGIVSMVNSDGNGGYTLSQDIPEVNRRRVEDWLNPTTPMLGWHGSQNASKRIKKLKAMCVLQELDLTKRCIDAGISVYSSTRVRKRDYLLTLLYNLQNRFL